METGEVKVSAERLKRKYLERRRGLRDANSYYYESFCKTRKLANRAKHASQNPN